MASQIEILIQAKNQSDAAFKALLNSLQETGKEAKKTNSILETIAGDLKGKLGDAAKDSAGKLGALGSTLSALGPVGIGVAAGIGAVVAAIGAVVKVSADAAMAAAAYGDKIADLASKTDLSVQSLQAFDVMARTGNTSVEAIAAATLKMGRNIVEGSDAFRRLGLDINKLKEMSPEEQFKAVAVAIDGLGTNAERSAARVAIFGKSGDELTTVLHEAATGATELGGALSDDAVAASAELQDKLDLMSTAWERVILQFGAAIAQSPEVQAGIQAITDGFVAMATSIGELSPYIRGVFQFIQEQINQTVAVSKVGAALLSGHWIDAFSEIRKAAQDTSGAIGDAVGGAAGALGGDKRKTTFGPSAADIAAAKAAYEKIQAERIKAIEAENKLREHAATEWEKFYATLNKEEYRLTKTVEDETVRRNAAVAKGQIEELEERRDNIEASKKSYEEMAAAMLASDQRVRDASAELWRNFGNGAMDAMDIMDTLGISGESAFGQIANAAAQTAGMLSQAAQQGFISWAQLGQQIANVYKSGSAGGGALSGAMTGFAIGGPIGAGIGAIGGALLGLFGSAKKAREEMNKLRDDFVKSAGGMAALKAQAQAAGVSLDGMFKAKSAAQLSSQIDAIKAKLQDWDDAQKILTEGMSKWGIAAGDMGSKFASMELDKRAREMALFFAAAGGIGANMGAVAEGMKKDVLDLVSQYQAAGLAIPAAMRPILEAMLKNGQLVDENGEAYGSLEAAGITFAETMEGALSKIGDEINKLMQVLARGFNIPINFEVNGSPSAPTGGATGGGGGNHPPREEGVPEFAGGGRVNGATYLLAGEAGPETLIPDAKMAAFLAQAMRMAGAQNGGGTIVVPVNIGNQQLGKITADLSRRRQSRTNPSGIRRF